MEHPAPGAALAAAYPAITAVVTGLDEPQWLLPSGCRGWTVSDLLLHVTLDARRALVALASPADGPPDVDSVTYWRAYPGTGDPGAAAQHAQWVRRTAAAFDRPGGVLRGWAETAPAAVRAATAADPATLVSTQDHVLTVSDFLATLVTEAVVHHLDLIAALPNAPEPPATAVAIAVDTLRGLAGADGLPAHWDDRETLLKGTGRIALDAADRQHLGARSASFPLLS